MKQLKVQRKKRRKGQGPYIKNIPKGNNNNSNKTPIHSRGGGKEDEKKLNIVKEEQVYIPKLHHQI